MKFVCLGYYDEKMWEAMSESEQQSLMDELTEMVRESEKRRQIR